MSNERITALRFLLELEIAFAYPYTVAVSPTHVFVGDLLSSRIAKLRLAYAVEAVCEVNGD